MQYLPNKNKLLLMFLIITATFTLTNILYLAWGETTPTVSTRGHFDLSSGNLLFGHTATDYQPLNIPGLQIGNCPPEIVVYVHGWNADEESALSQFNVVKKSLGYHDIDYRQPVIGFSWDSDTTDTLDLWDLWDGWDWSGWSQLRDISEAWQNGKDIATQNGLKLGKFVLDFKTVCSQTNIRLIGHSMGARVILNALDDLNNDSELTLWNAPDRNYRVTSVHLLGAAVNPEEVSITRGFGIPIIEEVNQFNNKFSLQDDVLEIAYRTAESPHIALGEEGAQDMASELGNKYYEEEVSYKISRDSNGDSIYDKPHLGDDHMGYAGVVNKNNGLLTSYGVMDLVVTDWSNNQ
jgi:pimeloyl-ACP methyl ester carboxylesterase